jgi:hypothetical protein
MDQNTRRQQKSKIHPPRAAGKRGIHFQAGTGNEVVYSKVMTKARKSPSRKDVESRFEGEVSNK